MHGCQWNQATCLYWRDSVSKKHNEFWTLPKSVLVALIPKQLMQSFVKVLEWKLKVCTQASTLNSASASPLQTTNCNLAPAKQQRGLYNSLNEQPTQNPSCRPHVLCFLGDWRSDPASSPVWTRSSTKSTRLKSCRELLINLLLEIYC